MDALEIMMETTAQGCQLCEGRGAKKRINQLVRLRHELQAENQELRQALGKYEDVIRKYKAALVAARRSKI